MSVKSTVVCYVDGIAFRVPFADCTGALIHRITCLDDNEHLVMKNSLGEWMELDRSEDSYYDLQGQSLYVVKDD